ncbi:MAG TPA: ABC transporter permease [Bryobacteraceae bacterium]|jgi:predicted permease|nr:ABC transporter permease [Bryobacteraceae bacterium]
MKLPGFRHRRRDRDLDEEIRSHLQMAVRDRVDRGETTDGASSSARREFGNTTLIKEITREMWGWTAVERLFQDLRFTARVLRQSPGFAAVAILSIALGIGVNTAIFSLIDAVLLKPLAVQNPDRLVIIGDPTHTGSLSEGAGRSDIFSYPFFERLRARQQVFTEVYASGRCERLDVTLANGLPVSSGAKIRGRFVTGNFFSLLGVSSLAGRVFTEPEVRIPGSAPVMVIGYGLWQRAFAGDLHAVGQTLVVNGSNFTIIGVMPAEFSGDVVGAPTDIWFPITMQAQANPGHDSFKDPQTSWLLVMGRLKPGVSLRQADASVQVIGHRLLEELYKNAQSADGMQELLKARIEVTPGGKGFSRVRHDLAAPLMILMGIVVLVLLISCANVANLQLARAAARGREMSLRLAVGASRTRLVRQLLTESLVISAAGAGLGLVFALWGTYLFLQLVAASTQIGLNVRLDGTILLFTVAAACLAGLLFGIVPAIQGTRLDLISMLKESKAGQPKAFARGLGKALVVSQIVFSLVLLVCAGLFIRTLRNLEQVDVGYARNGLLLADLDFKAAGYQDNRIDELVRNLLQKMQALPGVESVSVSENGLFSGTDSEGNNDIEGFVARARADRLNRYDRVGPNYFYTIGARIVAGRGIGLQDTENAPKVAVINEKMAQFYFPHENPIGRHIFDSDDPSGKDRIAIPIVGVVRDVKQNRLREPAPRRFYFALLQHRPPDPIDALNLEIRTRVPSKLLVDAVRRAVKDLDSKLPLNVNTADDLIRDEVSQEKVVAQLSSFFGLLAVVLAAIGLYGVMSYLTARRTTEIGIRMALGARRPAVMGMVLGETLRLVALGVLLGVAASALAAGLLAKSLFGLPSFDLLSTGGAAAVIAMAAALATYLPARRAARIDPMTALRYE